MAKGEHGWGRGWNGGSEEGSMGSSSCQTWGPVAQGRRPRQRFLSAKGPIPFSLSLYNLILMLMYVQRDGMRVWGGDSTEGLVFWF